MAAYLFSLALTIVIESLTALLLGYRQKYLWPGIVLVNLFTHPMLHALVLANARYGVVERNFLLCALEAAVVLVEAHLLADTLGSRRRSFLKLSFLMNLSSFATGLLLSRI